MEPMNSPRALFEFTPTDFTPVESHLEKWRFDADVLPHVRLLSPTKGRAIHTVLADYVSDRIYALSERYFADVEEFDASRDEAEVASWLRSHDADTGQDVLVSHGSRGVYVVTWGLFYAHWSSFCMPASDDVVISPVSEAWILMYYHDDVFFWGRPIRKVGE